MTEKVRIIINPGFTQPDPMNGDNPEAETPARNSLSQKTSIQPKDDIDKSKVRVVGVPSGLLGKFTSVQYVKERVINEGEDFDVEAFKPELEEFVNFCLEYLELDITPTIVLKDTAEFSASAGTFATFNLESEVTTVAITDRHPMDVFRSIAHELTHLKQLKEGRLEVKDGKTGSVVENEANATAGIILRKWAGKVPKLFDKSAVRKAHLSTLKKRYQLATTGGNSDEYGESVEVEGDPINEISWEKRTRYIRKAENDVESRYANDKDDPKAFKREKSLTKAIKKTPLVKPKEVNEKDARFIAYKADRVGIAESVLLEVFNRGIADWETSEQNIPQSQYAFNRMNSFIAGGRALDLDEDLVEAKTYTINSKTSNKSLVKLAKRKDDVGSRAKAEISRRQKAAPPKVSHVLSKLQDHLVHGKPLDPETLAHLSRASNKSITAVVNKAKKAEEQKKIEAKIRKKIEKEHKRDAARTPHALVPATGGIPLHPEVTDDRKPPTGRGVLSWLQKKFALPTVAPERHAPVTPAHQTVTPLVKKSSGAPKLASPKEREKIAKLHSLKDKYANKKINMSDELLHKELLKHYEPKRAEIELRDLIKSRENYVYRQLSKI